MERTRSSRGFELLGWLLALTLGVALRCHQLSVQAISDDEWHALMIMRQHGWWYVFTHFGVMDHCVPLTLLQKLLYRTVGLDEVTLRLFPLLCGTAAIVVLPLAVRSLVGPRAAVTFALLLAVSPLAVSYSRTARPYAISMPAALLAAICLWRWYRLGSRPAGWCACACAILATWFHATSGPFVVVPFAVVLVHAWRARGNGPRRARDVLRLGGLTALGMLLLLGPPLLVDLEALRVKTANAQPNWTTWFGMLTLFAGSASAPLVLVVLVVAEIGILALWRKERLLAVMLLLAGAVQLAAIVASGALALELPIVFARYALPLSGILLLALALGVARLADPLPRWLAAAAPLAAAGVLLWAGPIPSVYWRPNNWSAARLFQTDYELATNQMLVNIKPSRVPQAYLALQSLPVGSVTIVEAPLVPFYDEDLFGLYQMLHRQWTIGGIVEGVFCTEGEPFASDDPGARFRTLAHVAEIESLRARGVEYVVLHKDFGRELPSMPLDCAPQVRAACELYRRRVGAPVFTDDLVDVFALRPASAR